MKTTIWLVSGMMALSLWGIPAAHAQTSCRVAPSHIAAGSNGLLMRTGSYQMLSVVGQPVAGAFYQGLGGIWSRRQKARDSHQAGIGKVAEALPTTFALEANYPNPFNPSTNIRFMLPNASAVRLVVYDVWGREVARLVDGSLEAGWHTVVFDGQGLPSGLYVYRIEAGSYQHQRAMLLVK